MFIRYSASRSKIEKDTLRCERCGSIYQIEKYIRGESTADSSVFTGHDEAKALARRDAERAFRHAEFHPMVIPTPCTSCGWYQQAMVRSHKRSICPIILKSSLALSAFSGFCVLLAMTAARNKNPTADLSNEPFVNLAWAGVILFTVSALSILAIRIFSDLNNHPLIKKIKRPPL